MRKNVQGRLSTDTKDLRTLCDEIRKGEIKVPSFQRKYVWKEEQALDLLDSIANNYPVEASCCGKPRTRCLPKGTSGTSSSPRPMT